MDILDCGQGVNEAFDQREAEAALARPACSARRWYYARVKNSSGMHTVFYGKTRPKVGATCEGIATPNRITGYWLRPEGEAPNTQAEPSRLGKET